MRIVPYRRVIRSRRARSRYHSCVVGIALGFLGFAVVFGVLEWRWPARRQSRVRRGFRTDIVYWVVAPPVVRALTVATVVIVAVVVARVAGVPANRDAIVAFVHRRTWFGDLPRGVQAVLVLVVGDLVGYWVHRALHARPLWRFHAVHHSSQDLDWLSTTRGHPVDEVLIRTVQTVTALAVGVDATVVSAYVPVLLVLAIGVHANVPWRFGSLRYAIASPAFHRWHHAKDAEGVDKNFAGLFPLWDLVFGTYYLPRELPEELGVREAVPEGVLRQLAWPFRRSRAAR
jgi:sterol desaturase/sphingolipid hydroxylase (fatty acid hydroxylase superfamily)